MELGLGLTKIIPMVLYLVGLTVAILTIVYRVEIGIFFTVAMLPLQNLLEAMSQYPSGDDFLDILWAAMLIKTVMNYSNLPKATDLRKPMNYIVIAICVWTFIELIWGSVYLGTDLFSLSSRFETWKNYVMLPILYFIIVLNIKDEKHFKIILVLMSLSMLFMDRDFYHNITGRDRSHYREDLRSGGTFVYLGPNELAVFYAQNSILVLCLFLMDGGWRKWLFLTTTIFNYFCAIFLYSRGGYLAIIVSWMFLGFVKDRRVLVALVVFFLFWRTFTPQSVQERIDMTETEKGVDTSVEYRYEMWEQALQYFSASPIFGVGYNVIPSLGIKAGHARRSLHNGYLEVAVEQGVIGLLIYLAFFFVGIRYGWRLYRTAEDKFFKGLGLGFAGCVFAVMGGNIFGSYWFYINVSGFYWANLALVVRACELAEAAEPSDTGEGVKPEKRSLRERHLPVRVPPKLPVRTAERLHDVKWSGRKETGNGLSR